MDHSIVVAQANGPQGQGATPTKVITINKPQAEQAVIIHLDGSTKLDLSAIANESITLVHVGDRLIILFDNHAEVTIEPFFDDNGKPLQDITVELGPNHDVTSYDFASLFPITTDQSVLPASGGPGAPSSGGNFVSFTIGGLGGPGGPLGLLGPEGTTPGQGAPPTGPLSDHHGAIPPTLTGASVHATTDEGGLTSPIPDIFGSGNDQGTASAFAVGVHGSLNALVDFHQSTTAASPFQFVTTAKADAWLASLGLTSHGAAIDHAVIVGNTLIASTDPAQPTPHLAFSLTLNADGSWVFQLLNPLDHPTGQGENTLALDLSGLIEAVNLAGQTVTLAHDFTITVIDDVPVDIPLTAGGNNNDVSGLVQESALTSLTDQYGSGTGGVGVVTTTSVPLTALVAFGADGPASNGAHGFGLVSQSDAAAWLTNLGISSHGLSVDNATISGDTLTALDSGNHQIFTLTINSNGTATFTLLAPLDDPSPGHDTPGTADQDSVVIDLSGLIQATDFDGDSVALVPGQFEVEVTDDIPTAQVGTPGATTVFEAGLTAGTPGDIFGTGSQTGGSAEATGTLVANNTSFVNFGADGPDVVDGAKAAYQFDIGSDSIISFGNTTANPTAYGVVFDPPGLLGPGQAALTSHGDPIDFVTVSDQTIDPNHGTAQTITAWTQLGPLSFDPGIEVFSLTVFGDGTFSFQLINPIDHPPGNGANSITLDLSQFVAGVDFDGDQFPIPNGALTVTIVDDVPTLVAGAIIDPTVNESGLSGTLAGGTDSHGAGTDPGAAISANDTTAGSLQTLVHDADGVTFQFVGQAAAQSAIISESLSSHGSPVNAVSIDTTTDTLTASNQAGDKVFTLQLNSDGSWTFTLLEPLDDGPNQLQNGTVIDLSKLITATDFDGDSIALSNDFKITVNDDAPMLTAATVTPTVNEGGLTNPPNSHGTGNEPAEATSATGSLTSLVSFGADGPGTFPLTGGGFQINFDSSHDLSVLQAEGLASNGAVLHGVSVTLLGGSSELVATDANGHDMFDLFVNSDGTYKFTLLESLDDGPNQHENGTTIDLSGVVEAMDFDGNTISLANDFKITVTDDAPVMAAGATPIDATVNESGLPHATDSYGTGSDLTHGVITASGAAGSLTALVTFGADGAAATAFKLVDAETATDFLVNQHLTTSHGFAIEGANFDPATDTLTALDSQGHHVFSLTVNGDGSWSFTLLEPLDDGPNQSVTSATIDLSGLVQAVDFDGSATTLSNGEFTVVVTDDTPALIAGATAVAATVNEGGLTSPPDSHGTGNEPSSATEASATAGSLQSLVQFGADGANATAFQFVSATAAGTFLAGQNLTSHGFLINGATIDTTTHTLTATDSNGDHVFTLTVNGDGSWAFNLLEPLDNGSGAATINLSGLVQAVDFDGSTVTLANDFQITVTDDTPTLTGSVVGSVFEGGLTLATDPFGAGNEPNAATTTGGSLGIAFGADGAAAVNAVSFADLGHAFNNVSATDANHNTVTLTSHGVALEYALINAQTLVAYTGATAPTTISDASVVFSVVLSATAPNGSYDFVLDKPLDQSLLAPGSLNLIFDFTAKDFDGNTTTGSFTVTDADDTPVTNITITSIAIEEGTLESGNPTPTVAIFQAGSLTGLVNFGADGPAATAFHVVDAATALGVLATLGLTSNGHAVDNASVTGSTLTVADANNNTVFTLTVNGDGSAQFVLDAPIDGVPVNGTHELDISGFIEAIDFDGSTTTLAGDVHLEIDNDRPVVSPEHASVNEYTPHPPSANTPGTQTSVAVTLSETDGFPGVTTTFTVSALPANGTLYLDAGLTQAVVAGTAYAASGGSLTLYFAPSAFFAGTTSFNYTAADSNGATSPSGRDGDDRRVADRRSAGDHEHRPSPSSSPADATTPAPPRWWHLPAAASSKRGRMVRWASPPRS